MNFPRYKFSKETEPALLHFLQTAVEQKSKDKCDLKVYEVWKKLLPPDPTFLKRLSEYEQRNAIPTVDLCSDEESQVVHPSVTENEEKEELDINNKSTISDIASVVKDNLQTQDSLSEITKQYILKCNGTDLNMLFELLEENLSSEEVYSLGTAIWNIISHDSVSSFCHNLLIPKMRKVYCDELLNLLKQMITKYPFVLEGECLSVLHQLIYEGENCFLKYIKKMDYNFQSKLVRNFILSVSNLDDNNLRIIGSLLNDQVEYEALSKLVEMLSSVAEDHTSDKNFGELLMKVIDILGPNLVHLEQPFKHIIAGHRSAWKSKLEKKFTTCYEDSMLFTQSFRC